MWQFWLNINRTAENCQNQFYRSRSKSKYHVSVVESRMRCWEGKHEPEAEKVGWNHFKTEKRIGINIPCKCLTVVRLCMVAAWAVTSCFSWKDFVLWKKSHNFLVILSSRCQSLWHKPIAWNKTTDSYCLWVIPSNFLAILILCKVWAPKSFCSWNANRSFKYVFYKLLLEWSYTSSFFFCKVNLIFFLDSNWNYFVELCI